ncbi:MAG: hypothetical protein HRT71_11090 [Flavobacteriales bacterium]|nr:hypothetical protein [Flavobacteriales bacterium]
MNFQKDFINQLTDNSSKAGQMELEPAKSKKKSVFITLLVLMTFAAVFGASYITKAITITDTVILEQVAK